MTTLPRILSIVSLLLVWVLLSAMFPPTIVPGPVPVIKAMADNVISGKAFYQIYKTLLRVGFGLILTMVLGVAVGTVMGLSRKSTIGLLTGEKEARNQLVGSVAGAVQAALSGAQILRVHDVKATRQALQVAFAIADPDMAGI